MSESRPLRLTMAAEPAALDELAAFCARVAAAHNLGRKATLELNLVLDELCTNIMEHGYEDLAGGEIHLLAQRRGDVLRVEMIDDGRHFQPDEPCRDPSDCPLEERPVGGLGLHLVRRFTQRLEYRRRDGRNVTIIEKKIVEEDDNGNT